MDDRSFLQKFEAAAVARSDWTHREHIRVAFSYTRDLRFDAALGRVRAGIQALNQANGEAATANSGYHETVTVAWVRIVAAAVRAHGPRDSFAAFARDNPHLLCKSLLRLYYSRERIQTPDARWVYVEPDLAPLPEGD